VKERQLGKKTKKRLGRTNNKARGKNKEKKGQLMKGTQGVKDSQSGSGMSSNMPRPSRKRQSECRGKGSWTRGGVRKGCKRSRGGRKKGDQKNNPKKVIVPASPPRQLSEEDRQEQAKDSSKQNRALSKHTGKQKRRAAPSRKRRAKANVGVFFGQKGKKNYITTQDKTKTTGGGSTKKRSHVNEGKSSEVDEEHTGDTRSGGKRRPRQKRGKGW